MHAIQSTSQLSALDDENLLNLLSSAEQCDIELSYRKNEDDQINSYRMSFKEFLVQFLQYIDDEHERLSAAMLNDINGKFVPINGDATVYGTKTFKTINAGNLSATDLTCCNIAELSARHALWS